MKLPPKPGAYFVLDQNPPQYYYRMTPEELHEWGKACAEAMREACIEICHDDDDAQEALQEILRINIEAE